MYASDCVGKLEQVRCKKTEITDSANCNLRTKVLSLSKIFEMTCAAVMF